MTSYFLRFSTFFLYFAATSYAMELTAKEQSLIKRLGGSIGRRYLEQQQQQQQSNGDSSCSVSYDSDTGGIIMTCDVCSDQLCLNEVCTADASMTTIVCDMCVTDIDYVPLDDDATLSIEEMCMTTTCDMTAFMSDDGTSTNSVEDACSCDQVTVDGSTCEYCAFCPNDGINYDMENQMSQASSRGSSLAFLMEGLALQCSGQQLHNDVPTSCSTGNTKSSNQKSAWFSGDRKRNNTLVGSIVGLSLVAIVGAILFVLHKRHHRQEQEDPKQFTLVTENHDITGVSA